MEVIQRISLRIGYCGKRGRCLNKECSNKTICMVGHEVTTEIKNHFKDGQSLFTKEVHRQWE